jgi:hypothetical protein
MPFKYYPMDMTIVDYGDVLQLIIIGLSTGIGSSLGAYIVNKSLVKTIERIMSLKNNTNNGKKEG